MPDLIHSKPKAVTSSEEEEGKHNTRRQRSSAVPVVGGKVISFAVGAASIYAAARLTLAVFHRTRRSFLRQLLIDVTATLKSLNVTFWADFGSLLGIYRDGDIIFHDNDVDLAVLNPDWPTLLPKLKQALEPKYSVKIVTPKDNPESHWIRVYCPLGMADLFGAYYKDGDSIVKVDCGHGDTMHIPTELVLPPTPFQWKDTTLIGPAKIEETLKHRYGETWSTPAYMEKGADNVENNKPYAKLFRLLARIGIKI